MNEIQHRLKMIEDDMKVIREFIYANGLSETFQKPTPMSDECWTHLNNIEIACDLTSEESLAWSLFKFKEADNIVKSLKNMQVDGETMEYILERVGMSDQMLRQLIMNNPESDTKDLLEEKISLNNK